MTDVAKLLASSVVKSYHDIIGEHVKESHYTDALEKLIDFVRDCSPNKRRDRIEAVGLYSRYSRWNKAERQRIENKENIDEIIYAILEMSDRIAGSARIAGEVALNPADSQESHVGGSLAEGTENEAKGRGFSEDSGEQTAQILKLPPHSHQTKSITATTQPGERQADDPGLDHAPSDEISEPELRRELSSQKLEDVLQTYLRSWRGVRQVENNAVVVRCRDITKSFGGNAFSLGPLSFDLIAGEITGVVGMNASGKTTLLRLLLGELAPDSGTISYPRLALIGKDWLLINNQIAYVPQMPERWNGRLRLNLNYTAAVYGSKGRENDELVDSYVHRYGLKDSEDLTWDRISGGFKIRVELVRALLTKPKLLILDEPLAYLDIVAQQIFLSDIRSISSALDNPIPIVVTSQHLYEIESIANQMIILKDGRCEYSGPIAQMPHLKEFRTYEITVRCEKKELLEVLRPFRLVDLELTVTSFILTFPAGIDHQELVVALVRKFGSRLTYLRDITRSTRSLFRNDRDDIRHETKQNN